MFIESECVSVALVIQRARFMRHIVMCPACSAIFLDFNKRHYFRINIIEHKTCVLIFCSTLPAIFLILRRIQRDIITKV